MKELEFHLEEPLEYAHDGDPATTEEITLKAPKTRQRKTVGKLKQYFFRALPKDQTDDDEKKQDQPQDEVEIKGDEIIFLIAQSDVDYTDFIEQGRKLMLSGTAEVAPGVPLTDVLIDRMSIDDVDRMIGEYVATFIVRSALKSVLSR